ncbi:MAG: aldo/keto reductase [bacterium]|jgi:predicted aldo/keto reductase-like oxidoreductase
MSTRSTDKPGDLTRRKFISTSLTGLAAAGIAGVSPGLAAAQDGEETAGSAAAAGKPAEETKGEMIHRTLGKTGISLPIVSMGAMNADNPEVVKASYEMGVRLFDTAALYAFGRNEQMLGKVIKDMGIRDEVVIGTKELLGGRANMSDEEAVEKFITLTEGSLKRLQVDYVDIIYLHSVPNAEGLDPACFEAMNRLKQQGKARFSGISTHQSMTEIITAVTENDLCDVVLTSMNVSLADDADLLSAIDAAAEKGIGILAMKTQAGGRQLPNQDSLNKYESGVVQSAMLKWVMRHESITTAIPGYTSYQHMKEDVSVAFSLEYTEDEKRFLADNEMMMGLGFCRQCGACVASCPHGVAVPELMRTHMYAAQYSNFRQARATLDEIPAGRSIAACKGCDTCSARCAHHVDIAYRIEDLKLIYA